MSSCVHGQVEVGLRVVLLWPRDLSQYILQFLAPDAAAVLTRA